MKWFLRYILKWLNWLIAKVYGWIYATRQMNKRSLSRTLATATAVFLIWMSIHLWWPSSATSEAEAEKAQISEVSYSEFQQKVKNEEVKNAYITRGEIVFELKNGVRAKVHFDKELVNPIEELEKSNVPFSFSNPYTAAESSGFNRVPLLIILIVGIWIYLIPFGGIGPNGGIRIPFWKPNIKLGKVTFADVAGLDDIMPDLKEIVEFLKDPKKIMKFGGRIPSGTLLVGPPGSGKTLIARALAGEAKVPFHIYSGSDFVEMFVGVGASRVRGMFDKAKSKMPCIVFIDEIDIVGSKRSGGASGGDKEHDQTTTQLLVEMDGFKKHPGIIFVAATNRPENLDPALLRPGRFGRQIVVPLPDVKGREQILEVHVEKLYKISGKPFAHDVELSILARGTSGFSGADLEDLVNEASLIAAKKEVQAIDMQHFAEAKDKVMMGAERKLAVTDEDLLRTAYHEVGHAFVAIRTPGSDPVEKVSIKQRGRSLGVMIQLPEKDRHHYTKSFVLARIAIAMGGRAAEEIFCDDDISAGASSDIDYATDIAENMVCRWGMGKIGPLAIKKSAGGAFLGGGSVYTCSPGLQYEADEEIRSLINEALVRASEIIKAERELVEILSKELFKKMEISGKELMEIIERESLKKKT